MKHYAISSFCPDDPYWGFHWPSAGLAQREQVVRDMRDLSLFKVLALPCRDPGHVHWQAIARWVVLEIDPEDFVERDGFVDFRRGIVLFNGPPREACAFLGQRGLPVPSSLQVDVAGDWANATVGKHGVAVTGWDGVARAGDGGVAYTSQGEAVAGVKGLAVTAYGEVTAGERGFAITLYGIHATAGDFGLARTDEFGTAKAGTGGMALTSTGGTAIVGDRGLALAGGSGTAISGEAGVSLAWDHPWESKVRAGRGGILLARWFDGSRSRIVVAYVGENGIQPDTPYQLNEEGQFVEAE